jgi:hypothetical protein
LTHAEHCSPCHSGDRVEEDAAVAAATARRDLRGGIVYRISVDTGGTFTDVVVKDAKSQIYMSKALTTRDRAYLAI